MHILITGSTSGLGLELAMLSLEKGHIVTGVGKKQNHSIADYENYHYISADLSRESSTSIITEFIWSESLPKLDRVYFNAAKALYGGFLKHNTHDIGSLLYLNFYSPVALAKVLIPFTKLGGAKYVFIGSIVSDIDSPLYPSYCASKFALESFAKNIKKELKGDIEVFIKRPGPIKTEFHKKMGFVPKSTFGFASPSAVASKLSFQVENSKHSQFIYRGHKVFGVVSYFSRIIKNIFSLIKISRHMNSTSNKDWVMITGAANGIGKALAHEYSAQGLKLLLIDIDKLSLKKLAREIPNAKIIYCDIAASDLAEKILEITNKTKIGICIHNAGVNFSGSFSLTHPEQNKATYYINFLAPTLLTFELISKNLITESGQFIFISSLSHYVSYPGSAVYGATKDGIHSFANALSYKTSIVYPGPTQTKQAILNTPLSTDSHRSSPTSVAKEILKSSHRQIIIPGYSNKLIALVSIFIPPLTSLLMEKTLLRKQRIKEWREHIST
jgi:short-subunit dehydrogenase